MLLVLKEDEFERADQPVPLPVITIKNKDALPPVNETWLWAHVHSDADIPESDLSSLEKIPAYAQQTRNDDPDQFVLPPDESKETRCKYRLQSLLLLLLKPGGMAGLKTDADTSAVPAQKPSWRNAGTNGEMPVYFEWISGRRRSGL